ncbi:MAG TPA: nitrile hydratase accessory protein [Candidatus Binataceae bacterium]|nr:nitrile hydratase accessory protein [Candidatus Binataceae bacterium]
MSRVADRIAADRDSPAAIPRRNGEPVFNEPWESRVFAIAVALCERGLYDWDEFRDRLIAEISAADRRGDLSTYYERFMTALERLMLDKGICLREEIDRRAATESAGDPQH